MSNKQDPDVRLDREVASLSRDIRPQTDLWAHIEPELSASEPRLSAQRRLALFGAAVASVLLVGALLIVNPITPTGSETQARVETSAEADVVTAYETAIAEHIYVLHRADGNWGNVDYQLQVFQDAVAEIRFALSFQPHNQDLLQQLQDVYQQQLAWLQVVSSYNSATLS